MLEKKDTLQITLKKRKSIKNKYARWWYWEVWFTFWYIWRPRILSKFYWFMSEMMIKVLPKSQREELRKEYDEIDVIITDDNENMSEIIKESIKNQKIEL